MGWKMLQNGNLLLQNNYLDLYGSPIKTRVLGSAGRPRAPETNKHSIGAIGIENLEKMGGKSDPKKSLFETA